ncbi:hypothetical protein [Heyndrickxia vini]|uniref:Uncharacterized protein n=1 Tax=Heyndrickxia vini TaxID=1476025 RepID=A0ABX7E5D4_9BACI|nr:hypothetical protein [Heyndrickxia vini]QQZ10424.1 hypothetical protein I5776_05680 [Heyndrickxia vini]
MEMKSDHYQEEKWGQSKKVHKKSKKQTLITFAPEIIFLTAVIILSLYIYFT